MNQDIKNRINQIKSGQVPEGYKKTLVGIVPKEWVGTTLSEIFTFKNGLNKEKEAFGTGTPIVNYVDVYKKRGLKASDLLGRVTLSKREISNYNVRKGDVFFTRTSETIDEIGLSSVILDDVNDTVFSGFILRARPYNDRIITEYNQYCYSSSLMRHEIKKKSSCTTRALTNGNLLGQVNINLPSKTEQAKIAEILMKWDEAIEAQEQLINKLEIRKKALMQKLTTPEPSWIKISLKEILKERKTYSTKNTEYTHVTLSKEGVVDKTDQYNRDFLVSNDAEKKYKITKLNDLCYNPANLKFGVICLNTYGKAIFSPIYVTFNINSNFDPYFISMILTSNNFINYIRKYEEGSLYERQAVKPSDFLKGYIHIPKDINEQKRIANILSLADKEIELHKQQLEQLTKQRKSMMQLLLTGIVRTIDNGEWTMEN